MSHWRRARSSSATSDLIGCGKEWEGRGPSPWRNGKAQHKECGREAQQRAYRFFSRSFSTSLRTRSAKSSSSRCATTSDKGAVADADAVTSSPHSPVEHRLVASRTNTPSTSICAHERDVTWRDSQHAEYECRNRDLPREQKAAFKERVTFTGSERIRVQGMSTLSDATTPSTCPNDGAEQQHLCERRKNLGGACETGPSTDQGEREVQPLDELLAELDVVECDVALPNAHAHVIGRELDVLCTEMATVNLNCVTTTPLSRRAEEVITSTPANGFFVSKIPSRAPWMTLATSDSNIFLFTSARWKKGMKLRRENERNPEGKQVFTSVSPILAYGFALLPSAPLLSLSFSPSRC